MRRGPFAVGAGALLALALVSCAGGAVPESSSSRPPFRTTAPSATPLSPGAPSGTPVDPPAAAWDAVVAALTAIGVTGEPTLVSSEAVTWSDGSLGCGAPGQSYTQALVDGLRIVVEVAGRTYDYRFGDGDTPVLCEPFTPGALRAKGVDPNA